MRKMVEGIKDVSTMTAEEIELRMREMSNCSCGKEADPENLCSKCGYAICNDCSLYTGDIVFCSSCARREEMAERDKTTCACGQERAEMDLDLCNICGETICDACGKDGVCNECLKVYEEVRVVCPTCGKEDKYTADQEQKVCVECAIAVCPFCGAMDVQDSKLYCKDCLSKKYAAQPEKEEPKETDMTDKRTNNNAAAIQEVKNLLKGRWIEDAVKVAHQHQLSEVNYGDMHIAMQRPTRSSVFGLCVGHGIAAQHHLYWVWESFINNDGEQKRHWLAFLADRGVGKAVYVDLKTPNGRKKMIELTGQLVTALKRRGLWKKEYRKLVK